MPPIPRRAQGEAHQLKAQFKLISTGFSIRITEMLMQQNGSDLQFFVMGG
jgi:hypothetical protein